MSSDTNMGRQGNRRAESDDREKLQSATAGSDSPLGGTGRSATPPKLPQIARKQENKVLGHSDYFIKTLLSVCFSALGLEEHSHPTKKRGRNSILPLDANRRMPHKPHLPKLSTELETVDNALFHQFFLCVSRNDCGTASSIAGDKHE